MLFMAISPALGFFQIDNLSVPANTAGRGVPHLFLAKLFAVL
jgi:hypothetical protein